MDKRMHDSGDRSVPQARWFVAHRRRWPLALAVFLGATGMLAGLHIGAGRQLARGRLPESRQALLDLQPKPIDPGLNGAVLWRKAFAAQAPWPENAEPNILFLSVGKWGGEAAFAANGPLRAFLSANAQAFQLADEAAGISQVRWELDYSLGAALPLPHQSPFRSLSRALKVRAIAAAHDGDWEAVHQSLRTLLRASDAVAVDRILLCVLYGVYIDRIACEALGGILGVADGDSRRTRLGGLMELAVTREGPHGGWASAEGEMLLLEKRFGLFTLDRVAADSSLAHALFGPLTESGAFNLNVFVYPLTYSPDRRFFEDSVDQLITHSGRKGFPALEGGLLEGEGRAQSSLAPFSSLVLPALANARGYLARRTAHWRLALAGLQVAEFQARTGAWPKRLADAVIRGEWHTLLADPLDPQGHLLRHRVDPDGGFRLWSVGKDGQDQGGEDESSSGKGDDLVFRVGSPVHGTR